MTKQYLKMADVFTLPVKDEDRESAVEVFSRMVSAPYSVDYTVALSQYVAHAINSHDELVAEVERLREFERDAMRYRWLMQNTKFGIGRNGKDWDLQVDGSAPDAISEISAWIDNRMGWRMR